MRKRSSLAGLNVDVLRAHALAQVLYESYLTPGFGIHGQTAMPEDELPNGVVQGSLDHVLFLTLTVAIDYMRDADELWEIARLAFDEPSTHYLFEPEKVYQAGFGKVAADLRSTGLARKPSVDSRTWHTIAVSFHKKWRDDPRNLLADCGYSGPAILRRLKCDTHPERRRAAWDFRFLRGDKIGPVWLRIMRDNAGISFANLDLVPIPVDVHVARATFSTGVIRGRYEGPLADVFPMVRDVWRDAVRGLRVSTPAGDREMIAPDVDEPLWNLSRLGCSPKRALDGRCILINGCAAGPQCILGRVRIRNGWAEVNT